MVAPMLALVGARLFTGTGTQPLLDHVVLIQGDRIAAVVPRARVPYSARRWELDGTTIVPGFIDLQINGGGGVQLNDMPTLAGIEKIAAAHRKLGTTNLLPTLISDDWEVMRAVADATRAAIDRVPGVLGIHYEGPYLNPIRCGVHDPSHLRPIDPGFEDLFRGSRHTLVTLAPEIVPVTAIRRWADQGVRICIGHSDASLATTREALRHGATGFTHLFNAMSGLTARAPGVVGAALADSASYCSLIVDGHHVDPITLGIAVRAKASSRSMLVSDSMCTVGTTLDSFVFQGRRILHRDGRLTTEEGTLAGSTLDLATAVRNTIGMLGISPADAYRMASTVPAQFLGLGHELGHLAPGYLANLAILDRQGSAVGTIIEGCAYDALAGELGFEPR